ncbi:hypothetical protein GOODEAATRI_019167 [Goodea atripinnis]|uniref:Uncharacterized protein n=1 Tax=Goodea atripinnis TaxID=208336 RepID=A0ABV0MJ19_9TELE
MLKSSAQEGELGALSTIPDWVPTTKVLTCRQFPLTPPPIAHRLVLLNSVHLVKPLLIFSFQTTGQVITLQHFKLLTTLLWHLLVLVSGNKPSHFRDATSAP